MASPSRAALTARLEAADRASLVAFVADLYAARGATVERLDGDEAADLVVTAGDDEQRVAVRPDSPSTTEVGTVVTVGEPRQPTDATVVTIGDLHEWLCYAIPRDRAERLLGTHLACGVDDLAADAVHPSGVDTGPDDAGESPADSPAGRPPSESAGGDGGVSDGDDGDSGDRRDGADGDSEPRVRAESSTATSGNAAAVVRRSDEAGAATSSSSSTGVDLAAVGLGVFALVVVAATVASGPGIPLGSALLETVGGDGGGDRVAAANETWNPRTSIDVNSTRLPPGVSDSGELDERVLAETTMAQLHNRSYRVTLIYREFVDGEPRGVYSEIIRVESGREYRADVTRAGEFARAPPSIAENDRYANGTVSRRYEDNETTVTSGALSPTDPFRDEIAQYLRWYLSVEDSYITDRAGTGDATTYRVNIDGDPYAGVANTTGSALVSRDGLVWSVRRSYDDPYHDGVWAVVTIRITGVGSTTAPEPDWAG